MNEVSEQIGKEIETTNKNVPSKDARTGYRFEKKIEERLTKNGYSVVSRSERNIDIPKQRCGKKHLIDIRLSDGHLISCKYNGKVYGTAEEKIPFECIKLQNAVDDSNGIFSKAVIILGGDKWDRKEYYLSEGFKERIVCPNVSIITEEMFDEYFPPKSDAGDS
jgi:hypothetical protein